MAEEIKKEGKKVKPSNDTQPKNFNKQLLDPNNKDVIEMIDDDGDTVQFEQVAIIPRGEQVYVILKPVEEMEGVKDDQALVFEIAEEEFDDGLKQYYLKLVENEVDIDIVFEQYYDMLRDAGVDVDSDDTKSEKEEKEPEDFEDEGDIDEFSEDTKNNK